MGAASRILQYVTDHWNGNPKKMCLEDKEVRAAKAILEILNSADEGDYDIKNEEFFTEFEGDNRDLNWNPEDEVLAQMVVYDDVVQTPDRPNQICFGSHLVDVDQVEKAVAFYGSRKGYHRC